MCKVGYVDDDKTTYDDYKTRLERENIDLLFCEDWKTNEDIEDWILQNMITCLLVDFRLTPRYAFNGTNVVAFINSQLPDLPCIILTSYKEDSIGDNLVVKNLIEDRDVMRAKDISEFVDRIKQSCIVFENRLKLHQQEFDTLFEKRNLNQMDSYEEERFLQLYKLLNAYGEVDDLPTAFLRSDIDNKIDSLLEKLDKFIDSKQS